MDLLQPDIRALAAAEPHNAAGPARPGMGGQPRGMGVVGIEDGHAARLEPGEDLALGIGNCLDAPELGQMDGFDRGDNGDMRPHHAGQRQDLERVRHSDLEHAELRRLRHARQRQRHAPMVVVGRHRGMDAPLPGQGDAQHFLGRGLADRTGDRDGRATELGPSRHSQLAEPIEHVIHDNQGGIGRKLRPVIRVDHGGSGPLLERIRHEIMAVAGFAANGEEQTARLDRPGIDGDRADGHREGVAAGAVHPLEQLGPAPERRLFGIRCHVSASIAARATSWSEKG